MKMRTGKHQPSSQLPTPAILTPNRYVIGVFLLSLSVCGLTAGGHVYVRDGAAMYLMSQSMLNTGWFDVSPDHPNTVGGKIGVDGKYYMPFGFLQPLLAIPFISIGIRTAQALSAQYVAFFAATILNWLITALLAAAMCSFFQYEKLPHQWAAALALASVFSTPLWVYSQTFFAEPLTALLGLIAWHEAIRYGIDHRFHRLLLSGIAAGSIPLIRPLGGILIPCLLLFFLLEFHRIHSGKTSGWILCRLGVWFIPIITGIGSYLTYNVIRFGHILETGYDRLPDGSPRSFTLDPLLGLKILILSPGKSVFVFAPLLLLVPIGVFLWFKNRETRPRAVFLISFCALYFAVLSTWARVEGGVCWGPRLILPLFPPLFMALAPVLRGRNRWLFRIAILLLAGGILIQAGGVFINFSTFIHQHADRYYHPENGQYQLTFSPIPGHWASLLHCLSTTGWRTHNPPQQTTWNRQSDLINPAEGLDIWWLHFWKDRISSVFLVTMVGILCLTGILGCRCLLPLLTRCRHN
ncbi:hypothetical protein JXA80_10590 [bacterium]|nr:hypothetical protein [candidate division CSSED10-310 bacterium]